MATVPAVASPPGDDDTSLSICATKTATPAVEDDIFVESSADKDDEGKGEVDYDEDNGATAWNVLTTLYLPIVLIWLRRSMFGTANLIRSLILGQLLHLLLNYVAPLDLQKHSSMTDSWWDAVTRWLHLALAGSSANKHTDAWPPPALTALAMLTVFCFVVHPDGLTWIMLGKVRSAMLSLLQSSTTFWTMLIHDYGIISTIAAGLTLAAIGCLLAIMLRTLTPRKRERLSQLHHAQQHPERKKKKKKGQYTRGRGRIRAINTARAIPEHEEQNVETTEEGLTPLMHDPATGLILNVLPPVPEPRSISPEIALRPRIQSYSTLESVVASADDQSATSSVGSFASAPTVQTTMTTNSDQSIATPVSDVPITRRKIIHSKSLHGMKKTQPTKRGTNLSVERGDGQLTPEKTARVARKVQKSLRTINAELKDSAHASAVPESRSTPRRGRANPRQQRGSVPSRNQHPPPVSPVPSVDTDSFFSSSISPYTLSTLNAVGSSYVPKRMPSSTHYGQAPIGSSAPPGIPMQHSPLLPISTSYSSPSYTQPYLQDVAKSPCWGTTPVRPPPGLGGLLVSHHQFDHTSYSPDLNENVVGGDESRIEAELQELGGRMVGSILDF